MLFHTLNRPQFCDFLLKIDQNFNPFQYQFWIRPCTSLNLNEQATIFAGLYAASKLSERGLDVLVLEGRNRIAGRQWTDRVCLSRLARSHSKALEINQNALVYCK